MTIPSDDSSADVPSRSPWNATDAAGFILERLRAESKDRGTRPDEFILQPEKSAAPTAAGLKVRTSLARSVDTYSDVLRLLFGSFAAEMAALVSARPAGGDQPVPVTVVGRPGVVAGGMVWIHNTPGGVVPGFTLRMTDLSTAGGARVGADQSCVEPACFESSSEPRRSAWVSFLVPGDAVPGLYYGHLLAEGLYDAAVPVRLLIR